MQCSSKALVPRLGTKCGRREQETDAGNPEERSSRSHVATVEGIRSSGRRRPSRGVARTRISAGPWRFVEVFSFTGTRTGDEGCPLDAEEGNVVGRRLPSACAPRAGYHPHEEDASFARSRDPRTSFVPSSVERKLVGGDAVRKASRSGKPSQEGGTAPGVVGSDARAARRGSTALEREKAWSVRKGRRSRPPSLRGHENSGSVPVRRRQLQKSSEVVSGLEYPHAKLPPKGNAA